MKMPQNDIKSQDQRSRRQRALQKKEQALDLITDHAPQAARFLIDLMHGRVRDHDGNLIEVHDISLRRMASEAILDATGLTRHSPHLDLVNGRFRWIVIWTNKPRR